MRQFLPFLLLIFFSPFVFSQSPSMDWVQSYSCTGGIIPAGVAATSGNRLVRTGCFAGAMDFDPSANNVIVSSVSGVAGYVTKTDANGGLMWVKTFYGLGVNEPYNVSLSNQNEIVISGHFSGSIDFDPSPSDYTVSVNGGVEYMEKLDSNGNFLWMTHYNQGAHYSTIDFLPNGDIFRVSNVTDSLIIYPMNGPSQLVPGIGAGYIIEKWSSSGALLWVKRIEGIGTVRVTDIACNGNGELYIIGGFTNTIDFDPGVGVSNLVSNSGSNDVFVQKLDSNGGFQNAFTIGDGWDDMGWAIEIDLLGNVYIGFTFSGVVDVDPSNGLMVISSIYGANNTRRNNGALVKYDQFGQLIWVKKYEHEIGVSVVGLSVNDSGEVLFSPGFGNSSTDMNPGLGTDYVPSYHTYGGNLFVRLDASGAYLWGFMSSMGVASVLNNQNEALFSGEGYGLGFIHTSLNVNNIPLANSGGDTEFLFKVNECFQDFIIEPVSTCDDYYVLPNNDTVNSSGKYYFYHVNQNNCDSLVEIDLSMVKIDTNIQVNGGIISLNHVEGNTYQWYNCNSNIPIPNATNSSFPVFSSGNYKAVIHNSHCSYETRCVSIIPLNLGDNIDNDLNVYPNPTKEELFISTQSPIEFQLYNTVGALVLNGVASADEGIKVSHLEPGIYFIKVNQKVIRVVVE